MALKARLRHLSFLGVSFDVLNYALMAGLCVMMLYPFLHILAVSLAPSDAAITLIGIVPPKFTFDNYRLMWSNKYIFQGFINSITRAVLGTGLSLVACTLTAYPLSRRYLPGRSMWTSLIVFTMFFSGGLIPAYLLVTRTLKLTNTVWALVLPGLIPTFSMLIMRNYLMTIPESLVEAARMDGASEFVILFRIMVPMSVPIMATVGLWTIVGHWGAWFDGILYIRNQSRQVLQVIMRQIVFDGRLEGVMYQARDAPTASIVASNPEMLKAATMMFTVIPIVLLFPFLQRFFVKGVVIGSLKG